VVESRLGHGTVILTAFPANAKWSNFTLKPEFVPLMLRMVSYVMRPSDISAPPVVPASAAAEIALANQWAPATGKVTDPDGDTATIGFERAEGQLVATYSNTAEKGFYSIDVSGGSTDQFRSAALAFAVNLSPDESNFEMISEEDLRDWLPGMDVKLVDASPQTQQAAGSIGEQREVWRALIIAMFAVIGIEFVLSTLGGSVNASQTVAQRMGELNPLRWVARMTGSSEHMAESIPGSSERRE
jgi:hypothetical protein